VVLAANHTGHLDGAIVLAMAPRPSQFLVLARTLEGFGGHLLRWSGQIPIDQSRGDRRALAQALLVVDLGPPVALDLPDGLPGGAAPGPIRPRERAGPGRAGRPRACRGGAPRHPAADRRAPDLLGLPNRRGRAVAPSGLNVT
jgi:1-acyl-sn-glycerol-3-phosphate acyltransferase